MILQFLNNKRSLSLLSIIILGQFHEQRRNAHEITLSAGGDTVVIFGQNRIDYTQVGGTVYKIYLK